MVPRWSGIFLNPVTNSFDLTEAHILNCPRVVCRSSVLGRPRRRMLPWVGCKCSTAGQNEPISRGMSYEETSSRETRDKDNQASNQASNESPSDQFVRQSKTQSLNWHHKQILNLKQCMALKKQIRNTY